MNSIHYTFNDWVSGHLPQNGPPDSLFDMFPRPSKVMQYRPKWGKYSEPARKANATRNQKRREKNLETFRREILPKIESKLDSESLLDAGITFDRPDLTLRSGFRKWSLGEKYAWIPAGDPREDKAREIGATPAPPDESPTA